MDSTQCYFSFDISVSVKVFFQLSVSVKLQLFFSFYYSYLFFSNSYSYFTSYFEEALFGKQALRSLAGTFNWKQTLA